MTNGIEGDPNEKKGAARIAEARKSLLESMTPRIVAGADIVVSIGKTVQYALACRVPVFVYDRFGGPEAAADMNFSGRCLAAPRSGADLAREVLAGYAVASTFVRELPDDVLHRFRLTPHIDRLLSITPSSNAERRARMAAAGPSIARERLVAGYIRASYVRKHRMLLHRAAIGKPDENGKV